MDQISSLAIKGAIAAGNALSPRIFSLIGRELKEMGSELHHAFFNSLSEYTSNSYNKHTFFSSLVLPNRQLKLKDFYLPLTLLTESAATQLTRVDDYPFDLINAHKDLLIVDFAGMGKSTIMKFMFLRAVEIGAGIPVFLELRKLDSKEPILNQIFNQLKTLDGKLNETLMLRLLQSGEFIFFLDGFDEIADADRSTVTQKLKDFKQNANKNRFIISSRDQVGLAAFSDFYRLRIKPLDFFEATELIKKYGESSEMSSSLIEKIKRPEAQPVHDFLTNPLLVSLLFKAYEHKQTIPLKKHIFYRQVFEALYENHDLSKDAGELIRRKLSDLDLHSFELVMRAVGFLSLESGKIEYQKDELLLLIEKSQSLCSGVKYNPQALLQDLISRVPLFAVDGNLFRWSHKSIQEYFAALYLWAAGKKTQSEVLFAMYKSERASSYINFFSLYSDIDSKGFRQNLLTLILDDLLYEFRERTEFSHIAVKSVKTRLSLTAFRHCVILNLAEDEYEKLDASYRDVKADPREKNVPFFNSVAALEARGVDVKNIGGGYSHGNCIPIVLQTQAFNIFGILVPILNFDFFKTNTVQSLSPPQKKPSKNLPLGYSVVTDDPSDELNSASNFDEVNSILALSGMVMEFDVSRAKTERETIRLEIEKENSTKFSF